MHDGQRPTIRRPVGPGEVGQGLLQDRPNPRSVRGGDHQRCFVGRHRPEERQLRAVSGVSHREVIGRSGDDGVGMRPVGVGHQDVAASLVDDLAVGGQTERWRHALDARTDGDDRDPDQGDEDDTDEERLAERRTSEEARLCGQIHGEPPFEARPCRALAFVAGPAEDGIEVLRHPVLGIRVEPLGDVAVEAVARVHAGRPSRMSGPGRASASSAARICFRPRYRRDLVVPRGIPSVAATSGNGRSR